MYFDVIKLILVLSLFYDNRVIISTDLEQMMLQDLDFYSSNCGRVRIL